MDDNTEYIDDDGTIIEKCPVCKNNIYINLYIETFRYEVEICYLCRDKKSMHERCARRCEDCKKFICPKHAVYHYSDMVPNLCFKCAGKRIIKTTNKKIKTAIKIIKCIWTEISDLYKQ